MRTTSRGLLVAAAAAMFALLAVSAAPAASAAPRPDNPNGASIQLDQTTVAPGGSLGFTGSGWTTKATTTAGAVIGGVKLDDVDQLNTAGFTAKADGTVQGRVTLPTSVSVGEHWLRFLSGSDQPGDPVRSLHVMFTVKKLEAGPTSSAAGGQPATTPTAASAGVPPAGTGGSGAAADMSTLPQTGSDSWPWVWTAAALAGLAVVLGAAARVRGTRRHRSLG